MKRRLTVVAIVLPLLLLAVVFVGVYKQEKKYDVNSTGHHAVGETKKGQSDGTPQKRLDVGGSRPEQDGNAGAYMHYAPQVAGDTIHPISEGAPAVPRRESMVHAGGHGQGIFIGLRRQFIVTAYCPCRKCCGPKACGVTASGAPVSANAGHFVAADRTIPFGTRICVPGYAGGVAVPVLDRGGAIRGNRLDLFFSTHKAASKWGRKTLTVEIIAFPVVPKRRRSLQK